MDLRKIGLQGDGPPERLNCAAHIATRFSREPEVVPTFRILGVGGNRGFEFGQSTFRVIHPAQGNAEPLVSFRVTAA